MKRDKKELSPESNPGRRPKRQKAAATNLPLLAAPSSSPPPPNPKSRLGFSTQMAKQLLLNQAKNGYHENFMLSPLSIDVVLGMVAAGSSGRALEKMLGLLGTQDMDEVKSNSARMMAVVADCGDGGCGGGGGPVFCFVNGAWVDRRFPLKDSYKEDVLKRIFHCDAKSIDFINRANEVVDEVNLWAKDASKGLIKDVLQHGSVSPDTTLVFANALYFKGNWTHKYRFAPSLTKEKNFYLLNGNTVSVPFMTSRKKYFYGSFDGFKVLKIPYESGKLNRRFSMYFFLPHEKDGLQNLLQKLCSDSGFSHQDYFKLSEARLNKLWIPKFEFSYSFDVSTTMEHMGISLPFVKKPKYLSEMMEIPKGLPFLSANMTQKVFIKVDEKGTKAAAVTVCGLSEKAKFKPVEKGSFVADHPFMLVIKEEKSRSVLFTGAVLDPSLSSNDRNL